MEIQLALCQKNFLSSKTKHSNEAKKRIGQNTPKKKNLQIQRFEGLENLDIIKSLISLILDHGHQSGI